MAERMEWELVPRVKPEHRDEVSTIAEEILRLDAALDAAPEGLAGVDEERLLELQARMARCLVSPCAEAQTPLLAGREQWRETVAGLFATLPGHEELDQALFANLMGQQHDCALCDGRTAFPGVSGVPCEFDLTPLTLVLPGTESLETVQFELSADEMLRLADELELSFRAGSYLQPPGVDAKLYLSECVRYLRFWARLGFGLAPAWTEDEAPA
jgi:hypothetical protein